MLGIVLDLRERQGYIYSWGGDATARAGALPFCRIGATRLENDMAMTPEARAARAAYKREWRRRNPDKVRAQAERYWQRRAERQRAEGEVKATDGR